MQKEYSLHFTFNKEVQNILNSLSVAFSCSKGEATRRSLRLFNQLLVASQNGNNVLLRDSQGGEKLILLN